MSARADPRGGRSAMVVPTATSLTLRRHPTSPANAFLCVGMRSASARAVIGSGHARFAGRDDTGQSAPESLNFDLGWLVSHHFRHAFESVDLPGHANAFSPVRRFWVIKL